ncbi:tRNA adenosine(34) deaminase TadA [Motiliproteus sp. SC1-56]|uniref:tRNA adenosine(34) deaminase TadA n=1 Tax=Motiliproteus sp. SC1-56 TaxID=2799565 RepID=UPI001A905085|nr:tRNA adenosine(34) deaminase TadA [Motiliproteus sp. SC1-56]
MQQSDDEYWMAHAMGLAQRAEALGEVPVGAVVVVDGQVVGEGWNQPISGRDPCAHAEIVALRDAAQRVDNYRLVGATLYVTIEPCTMCAGALIHARVQRLVFGASEPKAGAVGSASNVLEAGWSNHRIDYQGGVLSERCSEQISRFFRHKRERRQLERRLAQQARSESGSEGIG